MREVLIKKRKLADVEIVAVAQECDAPTKNHVHKKMGDPSSFSLFCTIGPVVIDRALCDLGASVSVLPLAISQKLKLGRLKPTSMAL
ncbi:hypothetical protein vseg_003373 [Gypsophila vaccaria]